MKTYEELKNENERLKKVMKFVKHEITEILEGKRDGEDF